MLGSKKARLAASLVLAGSLSLAGVALAQHEPAPEHAAQERAAPEHVPQPAHGMAVQGSGESFHPETHGTSGAHGHAHDETAPPGEINWVYGLIGESDSITESNLFFRTKGTPAPFLATLINFGILVFVLVKFGSKPLAEALKKRKDGITRDIDDASKMRDAAEVRLKEYRERLEKIEHEIERVRADFRAQGERDRERILREAEERRVLMTKDAEFLLAQELKQTRIDLTNETVEAAVKAAGELVAKKLSAADHERFAEAFVAQLETAASQSSGKGIAS